jgi:uncharacterized protein YqgQ
MTINVQWAVLSLQSDFFQTFFFPFGFIIMFTNRYERQDIIRIALKRLLECRKMPINAPTAAAQAFVMDKMDMDRQKDNGP